MNFEDLKKKLIDTWHSKPFTLIVPFVALGAYWVSHGRNWHAFPSLSEWGVGIALWTAKFEGFFSLLFNSKNKEDK